VQAVGTSVQGRVAEAIERFCGERVPVRGAGRTDAGVHALGQVAHFDLARARPPDTVRDALNHYLRPDPIAVLVCAEVDEGFDARFSATARHYRYRIISRRAPLAIERNRAWWLPIALDAEAMGEAAGLLVGRHDFTTFRAAQCQAASPVKTLDRLEVRRAGDEITIEASARSFLHTQVRSMVGSLKLVGAAHWAPRDVAAALAARDRHACAPLAPARGLYLVSVEYGSQPRRC
jgi:tRNA pseudouridine38-40 synthase